MVEIRISLCFVAACVLTFVYAIDNQLHNTCEVCICDDTTLHVNCSRTSLTQIPEDPTGKTVLLNMSSTVLTTIGDTDLQTFHFLQVLDLHNTSLNLINQTAFRSLTNLKSLNLSNNGNLPLTNSTLDLKLFSGLDSLTELRVYGNTATNIDDGYPDAALSEIKHLSVLWIDGLTNVTFGPAFKNMTSLKTIRIPGDIIQPPWRFCSTDIVDKMLDNLVHIINFTMRKCGVRFVSENAFKRMTRLVYLDLSYNKFLTLSGIANAFESLGNTQLEVLVLNSIENVVQISCSVTITKEIAKKLSNITTLKDIHLEYNAINGFERTAISRFPKSLEYFNAKKNEFELGFYMLSANRMENIKRIDISYNFFPDDTAIWHTHETDNNQNQYSKSHCEAILKQTSKYKKDTQYISADNRDIVKPGESNNDANKELLSRNVNNDVSPIKNSAFGENKYTTVSSYDNSGDPEVGDNMLEFPMNLLIPRSRPDFSKHFADFMDSSIDHGRRGHNSKHIGPNLGKDDMVCPPFKSFIPPGTIIANIPSKLESLDISHSKYAHPIPELYINETNMLKRINASHSLLYCWDGPIRGLKKLEYVDLSQNLCTNIRLSFFDGVPNLKYLYIGNNLLYNDIHNDKDGRILRNLTQLEVLDMSYNILRRLPSRFLINQKNLKVLSLTGNMLEQFEIEISHMWQLTTLDLSKNTIHTLSEETRNNLTFNSERNYKNTKKTLYLNLNMNNIMCYCNNLDFLQWVYEHMGSCRFLEVNISGCMYYDLTEKNIRDREDFGVILEQLRSHCASYMDIIIVVSICLCLLLNVAIGVAIHRFRWKIRYWYYVAPNAKTTRTRNGYISIDDLSEMGSRYKYDLYVVSVMNDREFVMDNMKVRLENEHFRLFIQDDDIVPGQNIYSIIGNAIHVSRSVIFVISEECDKEWEWIIAMRMSHEESLKRGQPVFFGLFIDHEPGTPYSSDIREMRNRSYVDYTGDTQPANEQTFWLEILEKIAIIGNQVLSFEASTM